MSTVSVPSNLRANQPFKKWLSFVGLVAVVVGFEGCGGKSPTPPNTTTAAGNSANPSEEELWASPLPVRTGFVGSKACETCHSATCESYHRNPMAHSVADPLVESTVEDFSNASFSFPNGLSYYVERNAEGVFHHERKSDAAGEVIYDQGEKISHAFGSGRHGRTYLINRSGRLFASPITWYTRDNKWALSPGYSPLFHARFDRLISDGCVVCHVGRAAPHETDTNRLAENGFIEPSIGCERCHGPGAEHIEIRSKEESKQIASDPIFNPAKYTDARRDAVCNQCHLAGRKRVLLTGRTEYDFNAGMALSQNWVVFVKPASDKPADVSAVSHAEQLYASKCYLASSPQMGCITCHTGHELPKAESVAEFYRAKCVDCHSPSKTECSEPLEKRTLVSKNDSCIECHMPRFAASDVHATQTDHRILTRPKKGESDLFVDKSMNDTALKVFEEDGYKIPEGELERAIGIYLADQSISTKNKLMARDAIELLVPAVKRSEKDTEASYSLGTALEAAGQIELAIKCWNKLIEADPRNENALESLATLTHQNGNFKAAREYYERLISVNPDRPNNYGRLAHVLGLLEEFPRGIEMAEKSLELNPSLTQSHEWLVVAYKRIGNEEKSAFHQKKLEQFKNQVKSPETEKPPATENPSN